MKVAERITMAGGRQVALVQLANEAAQLSADLVLAREQVRTLADVECRRPLTPEELGHLEQLAHDSTLIEIRLAALRREFDELTGAHTARPSDWW
jgi:hypothetical protein